MYRSSTWTRRSRMPCCKATRAQNEDEFHVACNALPGENPLLRAGAVGSEFRSYTLDTGCASICLAMVSSLFSAVLRTSRGCIARRVWQVASD
jgi:hypothetical protein